MAEDLAQRLSLVRRRFPLAVNLGAHHGVVSRLLRDVGSIDVLIDVERSAKLLARCDGPRVLGDEEWMPFRTGSLDLVVSGLALQFVNDLPGTLIQIRRALKPDGLMLAALLGGRTLQELRAALTEAEIELEGGASPRVAPFADVRDLGSLLQRADFALPVADADTLTVTYDTPFALMRDLRGMGAANVLAERRRTPLRRATLLRAAEIYAQRYAGKEGRVAATFEVVTLTGWVPHDSQQKPLAPGSATTRLADALGTAEQHAGEKTKPSQLHQPLKPALKK
ncbi:MAG TPA: methyltransferase domain-containing protein [Steroidobacteraceae bacterium]|nr:methyltransferase domain-containing protein [Steroidobacteraceae bacterium]